MLLDKEKYDILPTWETEKPKAAYPLFVLSGGSKKPSKKKGGRYTMYVTYQDFIQIGILIAAFANLFYQIYKDKKK